MGFKRLSPRLRLMLIGLGAALALVIVVSRPSQSFDREAQHQAAIERMRAQLQAGVGSEVRFASRGARAEDVRASLDSVAEFIRYRSGLELNGEVKGQLARLEERTLSGGGHRLPMADVADLITAILVERIHHCTDAEIEQAADALTNIKTMPLRYDKATGKTIRIDKAKEAAASANTRSEGDDPNGSGKCKSSGDITLRFSGEGQMTREKFIQQAQSLRSRLQSPLQQVAMVGIARQMVTSVVRKRLQALGGALPDQWAEAQDEGLTPAQAFLIAYSTISDDPLRHSRDELKNMRKHLERMWQEDTGEAVSYEGQTPFGSGGYLFSSPLGLALNQETTSRLLKLIEERSAK
ncbi:MAG: hypothetical protein ACJ74G_18250 [Blastocatellia bacterium]